MNRLEIQNERLLKFAEHLNSIKKLHAQLFDEVELFEVEDNIRIHFKVRYNYLIIDELPSVFPEFDFSEENSDPMLKDRPPEEGSIPGVISFFELTPEEFCQIFDVDGYQNTNKFGGRFLNVDSQPPDFAFNILQLVKHRFKKLTD